MRTAVDDGKIVAPFFGYPKQERIPVAFTLLLSTDLPDFRGAVQSAHSDPLITISINLFGNRVTAL
jgi:hypothetical protein